jgi:hypothetical protein
MRIIKVLAILLAVIVLLVVGGLIGFMLQPQTKQEPVAVTAENTPPEARSLWARVGERPTWPKLDDIEAIRVDMRLGIRSKERYQLYRDVSHILSNRDVLHPYLSEPYLLLLSCIFEAAVVDTHSCTPESSGTIELILRDGAVVCLHTIGPHYLRLVQNDKIYCMIFDADTFEDIILKLGKTSPD